MDPNAQLLAYAEKALDGTTKKKNGDAYSPAEVDAIILRDTQGAFRNISELRQGTPEGLEEPSMGTETSPEEAAAYARINERGGNAITDFAKQALHGLSFGTSDEIRGGLSALTGGGYTEGRDRARQEIADNRLVNPGGSMAAEALGGMVIPGAGGAKIGQAIVGRTGQRALGAIGGGAAAGALGGGVYGAGEAEGGLAERATGAAVGAATGGVVGGVMGGGGALLGRVLERTPKVGRFLEGPDDMQAQANLRRGLEDAGIGPLGPGEIQRRVADIGPEAVVADLSRNLADEARGAANRAPTLRGKDGPLPGLFGRHADRGERLAQSLRRMTGLRGTFRRSVQDAELSKEAISAKFYGQLDEEYAGVMGPNVIDFLENDPFGVQAIAKRRTQPGSAFGPQDTERLGFNAAQEILWELADQATPAIKQGTRQLNDARGYARAHARLSEAMSLDYDGFSTAQSAFALAAERVDAHELGRKAMRDSPEDIVRALNDLGSDEARDAYRYGILDSFEAQLMEASGGGGTSNRIIRADNYTNTRQRIHAIADSDADFLQLVDKLDSEGLYLETASALGGNSSTTQQQQTVLNQLGASAKENLRRMLAGILGITPAERRKAAELLGQVLLTDGNAAAELLAQQMSFRTSIAAVGGGVAGTQVGGAAGAQVSSLFDTGN